jgi:hypothetical protein
MPNKLSALKRCCQGTYVLLIIFWALVISVFFIGLDDVPGYVLGYLATAVLFFIAVRNWRTIRRFLILFAASLIGIFFLSFLYVEVICRIVVMIGGVNALQSPLLGIVEVIINYVILFAGPVGMIFGIVGVIGLGIKRLTAVRSRNSTSNST